MTSKYKVSDSTQVEYRDKMYGPGEVIEPRPEDEAEAEMWLRHKWVIAVARSK